MSFDVTCGHLFDRAGIHDTRSDLIAGGKVVEPARGERLDLVVVRGH